MVKSNVSQCANIVQENIDFALKYADLDWHIFPCWWIENGKCACGTNCLSPAKHPITALAPHGQKNATNDKVIISEWWSRYPKANIALFLEKSGLCAVDIDPRNGGDFTIEDLEHTHGKIESDVLALTGGGGEHRIFIKPNGNLPGKLGKGVDLKLNGYVIVAPSNHSSGGVYEWESSSDPLDGCLPSNLPDWIRDLANSQVGYAAGVKNAPERNIDSETRKDIIQALEFIDSDDRDKWLNVGMALHSTGDSHAYAMWCDWAITSSKFNSTDQWRVWNSFKYKGLSGIGIATIFAYARECGWLSVQSFNGEQKTIKIEDVAQLGSDTQERKMIDDTPEYLKTFPVESLNQLAEYIETFSRNPQYQITQAGVIALMSVICGRVYCSTENNTSALMMMILGDTGVGKNYVKIAIQQILNQCSMLHLLSGSGNTSPGAVFSALFDSPCHIQISDEIGKQLQAARKSSSSSLSEAFTTLTEAYSSTTSILIPKNYSKMGMTQKEREASKQNNFVQCPSITLLGLATPSQVFGNLSTVEIEDGFLNRFIVVQATAEPKGKRSIVRATLPKHLEDLINLIRPQVPIDGSFVGMDTAYNQLPVPREVEISDEALGLFERFQDELDQKEKTGLIEMPDLTRRFTENAMRLAVGFAVFASPASAIITSDLARWAIGYVELHGMRFIESVLVNVADSDFHRVYLKVKDTLAKSGSLGMTERELSNKCRIFASTPLNQRDMILQALIREDHIEQVKLESQSGRGRPRVAYLPKK